MSTGTGLAPPTRSMTRSWMARRSLACSRTSISEISSRRSVPPCASSNLPMRRATAPVKAPFSWPNSSLSRRFSGMAAQLTDTNGLSRRLDFAWTKRASTSLPVPLSPVIRIEASDGRDLAGELHHRPHGLVAHDEARSCRRPRRRGSPRSARDRAAAGYTPWLRHGWPRRRRAHRCRRRRRRRGHGCARPRAA